MPTSPLCAPRVAEAVVDEDDLQSRVVRCATMVRRLRGSLRRRTVEQLRCEVADAELAGAIPEFCALMCHAALAMVEGSAFSSEYLEMAEAVAMSPRELIAVAANRALPGWTHDDPFAVAERCLTKLEGVYRADDLWQSQLVALCEGGDTRIVDALLGRFAQLDQERVAVSRVDSRGELPGSARRVVARLQDKRSNQE
jgi:hypothetical protein